MTLCRDQGAHYASSPCMAGDVTPDYFDWLAGEARALQSGQANESGYIPMALKHAVSGESVDLRPTGHLSNEERTRAIVRTRHFEAVRLILPAGTDIPSHKFSGQIMFHCIEGHAQIGLESGTIDLLAGHWVYLDEGEPHSVKGVEASTILMTILFQDDRKVGDRDTV